jgi:hypothetical protein
VKNLYDYISIFSEGYSNKIKTKVFEEFIISHLKFEKVSNLIFTKKYDEATIRVTGILANSQGNYAIDTLENVEEINLIEIDIQSYINDHIENTILEITKAIANEYSWLVDIRD